MSATPEYPAVGEMPCWKVAVMTCAVETSRPAAAALVAMPPALTAAARADEACCAPARLLLHPAFVAGAAASGVRPAAVGWARQTSKSSSMRANNAPRPKACPALGQWSSRRDCVSPRVGDAVAIAASPNRRPAPARYVLRAALCAGRNCGRGSGTWSRRGRSRLMSLHSLIAHLVPLLSET